MLGDVDSKPLSCLEKQKKASFQQWSIIRLLICYVQVTVYVTVNQYRRVNILSDDFMVIVKCHCFYLSALTNSRAPIKMTVLQQISNPYLASLILGLLYGLTFCTSACLPYVISYIAGIGAGFRKGVVVTSIYKSKNWLKVSKVFWWQAKSK